jgi:hypothetical protein
MTEIRVSDQCGSLSVFSGLFGMGDRPLASLRIPAEVNDGTPAITALFPAETSNHPSQRDCFGGVKAMLKRVLIPFGRAR